jgi:hypothetical protein
VSLGKVATSAGGAMKRTLTERGNLSSALRSALVVGVRWFVAYVAIGGLLGFCVARGHAPFRLFAEGWVAPPSCLPQRELFDTIASRCPVSIVNWFWMVAVGLPRLVIVLIGLPVVIWLDHFHSAHGEGLGDISLHGALVFGVAPVLVVAVLVAGVSGWWQRQPVAGVAAAGVIAIDLTLYSVGLTS